MHYFYFFQHETHDNSNVKAKKKLKTKTTAPVYIWGMYKLLVQVDILKTQHTH